MLLTVFIYTDVSAIDCTYNSTLIGWTL